MLLTRTVTTANKTPFVSNCISRSLQFRLHSHRVNAEAMKSGAHFVADSAHIGVAYHHDVNCANVCTVYELPHVQFMHARHAIDAAECGGEHVGFDRRGRRLHQHTDNASKRGYSCGKDDDDDQQGRAGIGVRGPRLRAPHVDDNADEQNDKTGKDISHEMHDERKHVDIHFGERAIAALVRVAAALVVDEQRRGLVRLVGVRMRMRMTAMRRNTRASENDSADEIDGDAGAGDADQLQCVAR